MILKMDFFRGILVRFDPRSCTTWQFFSLHLGAPSSDGFWQSARITPASKPMGLWWVVLRLESRQLKYLNDAQGAVVVRVPCFNNWNHVWLQRVGVLTFQKSNMYQNVSFQHNETSNRCVKLQMMHGNGFQTVLAWLKLLFLAAHSLPCHPPKKVQWEGGSSGWWRMELFETSASTMSFE